MPKCPVDVSRIKPIKVYYVDFDGTMHEDGEIMVLDVVEKYVHNIFSELLRIRFPINKIRLIKHYNGSDDESMDDNNTSSFNCRYIKGTDIFSIHAYGLAIDLNPVQNPIYYVESREFAPRVGEQFLDRNQNSPGMITPEVISIFHKNGFTTWGGNWDLLKDYHHFEVPRDVSEALARLNYEEGVKVYEDHVNSALSTSSL